MAMFVEKSVRRSQQFQLASKTPLRSNQVLSDQRPGSAQALAPGSTPHLRQQTTQVLQQKPSLIQAEPQRPAGLQLNEGSLLPHEASLRATNAQAQGAIAAAPKLVAQSVPQPGAATVQMQKANGWYRLNKAANFRNDNADYTVSRKLPEGSIVEVIDKGMRTSNFKAGWAENEHSWSTIPIHNLHGWIEDSKLSNAAKAGLTPHDEVAPRLLAHHAQQYQASGAHYQSKLKEGISFNILKQGKKFEIASDSPGLDGYLEYALVGKEIDLRHFEAQPEGLGLGSALMYEFAIFAENMGLQSVAVQTPALSAMGAYKAFGGKPQAGTQAAFLRTQQQYQQAMGLRNNALDGEHIIADHEDSSYDNFINEEAKALGKSSANRAAFDDPSLHHEALEKINQEAAEAHRQRHPRTVDNVKRVAELRALSPFLSYDVAELKQRSASMLVKKWQIH